MPLVHPLVAEDAADLVHTVEAADDQTLEVQLEGNAKVQIHVERVVMGPKRPCRRTAGYRLEHRRLHLDEAAAREENIHHLRVSDQVEVALPVAELLVF